MRSLSSCCSSVDSSGQWFQCYKIKSSILFFLHFSQRQSLGFPAAPPISILSSSLFSFSYEDAAFHRKWRNASTQASCTALTNRPTDPPPPDTPLHPHPCPPVNPRHLSHPLFCPARPHPSPILPRHLRLRLLLLQHRRHCPIQRLLPLLLRR